MTGATELLGTVALKFVAWTSKLPEHADVLHVSVISCNVL